METGNSRGARRAGMGGPWGPPFLVATGFLVLLLASASEAAPGDRAPLEGPAKADVTPPDLEDIEHMCALLSGCPDLPLPPQLIPGDFATCVRKMAEDLASPEALTFPLTMRECALRRNSCGDLATCALRGTRPDVCAGRGKGQTPTGLCDPEGRAVTCFREKVMAVRDCPRGGEQCAVRDGKALCTLGACSTGGKDGDIKEGAPAVCSPSGTRILTCESGRLVSLDCGAFGLRCTATREGGRCAPATPVCGAGPGAKRCEGSRAVTCLHGHEVRVDCAAAGLTCDEGAAGGAVAVGACASPLATPSLRGGAPGADGGGGTKPCDPLAPSTCDDRASLRYCFAGHPRTYLCKSLGFNRCITDRDKDGRRSAHCGK